MKTISKTEEFNPKVLEIPNKTVESNTKVLKSSNKTQEFNPTVLEIPNKTAETNTKVGRRMVGMQRKKGTAQSRS